MESKADSKESKHGLIPVSGLFLREHLGQARYLDRSNTLGIKFYKPNKKRKVKRPKALRGMR